MKITITLTALSLWLVTSCNAFQVVTKPKILSSGISIPPNRALLKESPFRTSHICSNTVDATMEMETETESKRKISLFNSLSLKKEPFIPILSEKVSMYTCGPTVYDYAHVGNFRAFLTYDVLKRTLSYFGYNVDHICNLTDVDDKIIAKCSREDVGLIELTRKFEDKFMDDLMALNIIPARDYPRATEHIDEMVELIQELEAKGLAYQSEEGSWYFNVAEKEGYGQQLVNLDVSSMKKGASGDAGAQRNTDEDDNDADEYDADKVGVRDFALWKAYKPKFDREDAIWDTKIGKGRPGWHLECSAMARKYLGDSIDVHCGGIDLKFPHHENEIAQSEGATGKKFCNCWLHNGFVNIGDEKMSKSKGNFLTLRGACSTSDDIRAYRYLVVSSQYRNPLSFTEAAVGAAKGALKRMDNVMRQLNDALEGADIDTINEKEEESNISLAVDTELNNFEVAIADDLSMPRAAASLFGVVKLAETEFKRLKKEQKNAESEDDVTILDFDGLHAVRNAILQMDKVFGIFYEVPKDKNDDGSEKMEEIINDSIPEEVTKLVQARTEAKVANDWDVADSLRKEITELGFAVKDVKGGDPIVSRI